MASLFLDLGSNQPPRGWVDCLGSIKGTLSLLHVFGRGEKKVRAQDWGLGLRVEARSARSSSPWGLGLRGV